MTDLLTFTTLYPNVAQPCHGLFVAERLRHLLERDEVRSRVVAPVPWFPFRRGFFGNYATFARVPPSESRDGLEVLHPRYPVIPKIGMSVAPTLMFRAVRSAVRRVLESGYDFDVIDAHYFYPDGVAAAAIGRWLDKPVVITARGTDVNLFPRYRLPRKQILWAAERAAAIITVSRALKDTLVRLGVSVDHVTVLRNGVDLERFRPIDRDEARRRLALSGRILLSVGHLVEGKGHHLAIEALTQLPDEVRLLIVGEGEWESRLRELARTTGVSDRVQFVGRVSQSELPAYYSAADALVLASRREGMANVVLESLACGTPVIGTRAGGTPEVVSEPSAGVLMARRDPTALAEAYWSLLGGNPDRQATRSFAERFDWDATTRGQLEIFARLRQR
jgi:glycosyltransferase involved in cell wall biosynthesis